MNKKRLYVLNTEDGPTGTLFITDDQAAVFRWLADKGYDLRLDQVDEDMPEEISAEYWNR
jgi:hypothetical protein